MRSRPSSSVCSTMLTSAIERSASESVPIWRERASVSTCSGFSSSSTVRPTRALVPSFSFGAWSMASTRTLDRMISELTISGAPLSAFLSRLVSSTSTRSLGRMKPPAPVSGEISVETARMPVGRIAAMKPEPSAFTSFGSRIGSPAIKGARAIMPLIWLVASGRSERLMKLPLALAVGQVCHCRSSGLTVWPSPISFLATRTSTVGSCATGAGAGLSDDPLARYAAMPPATTATARTAMRAGVIRFTFHITERRCRRCNGS
ncbi:hypothetical protein ES703_48405 [subsurface metagenome]